MKVIGLSETPLDTMSFVTCIITRRIHYIQLWIAPAKEEVRHLLALVCDEAHIYMANDMS